MENKENVYEVMEGSETAAAVSQVGEKEESAPEQVSSVLGKFKDVDALARAYGSLQAEFTRRSQRLRELERLTENLGKDEHSGVEKLRKYAQARRAEAQRLDEFLSPKDMTKAVAADTQTSELKPVDVENEPAENTPLEQEKSEEMGTMSALNLAKATAESAESGAKVTPNPIQEMVRGEANEDGRGDSGDLYERVKRDEGVRLRIIGEYLSSIGKSGAPLMTGGVGTLTTPPVKAHSISAAGDMALLYFKTPRCEN